MASEREACEQGRSLMCSELKGANVGAAACRIRDRSLG